MGSVNTIKDGSLAAKYMLDKISRLMKGQPVGVLKKYPKVFLSKPEDKMSYFPDNAYLPKDELLKYMDFDTIFYEVKPNDGETDLFLHDPSKSDEENYQLYKEKFPDA